MAARTSATPVAAVLLLGVVLGLGWLALRPPAVPDLAVPRSEEALARGEYLAHAAACVGCHIAQDGSQALTGGRELVSPFGTFYASNITPDPETGIGRFSAPDLLRAIRHGRSPSGGYYFPAFPYRAYRDMADEDAMAIVAWLQAQPPVRSQAPRHELPVPEWLVRPTMFVWNPLADGLQPELTVPAEPQARRGAYLARTLAHCGECHTPRNAIGIPRLDEEFTGAPLGDGHAEAITAEALADWTEEDFALLLVLGLKPDDDYVGGEMEPIIEHGTSKLTEADRLALAAFFLRPR